LIRPPKTTAATPSSTAKHLQSLSDDPDELAADLQAIAGLSAGLNPRQMYIDGFTTGQQISAW
jgi:hypothetical protein